MSGRRKQVVPQGLAWMLVRALGFCIVLGARGGKERVGEEEMRGGGKGEGERECVDEEG